MRRTTKADAWEFVMTNYGGLVMFYAKMYAKRQAEKRGDYWMLVQDYESEIRHELVKVYQEYYIKQERPMRDVIKMMKSAPYYYYWNVIMKKDSSALFVDQQVLEFYPENISGKYINVCVVGDIGKLYDYYYDMFIDHAYKLKEEYQEKDECVLLREIIAPSEEYCEFAKQFKRFMSISALKEFFKKRKNWTEGRFINTIGTMKSKIEMLAA
jgi:hypothetical protein